MSIQFAIACAKLLSLASNRWSAYVEDNGVVRSQDDSSVTGRINTQYGQKSLYPYGTSTSGVYVSGEGQSVSGVYVSGEILNVSDVHVSGERVRVVSGFKISSGFGKFECFYEKDLFTSFREKKKSIVSKSGEQQQENRYQLRAGLDLYSLNFYDMAS